MGHELIIIGGLMLGSCMEYPETVPADRLAADANNNALGAIQLVRGAECSAAPCGRRATAVVYDGEDYDNSVVEIFYCPWRGTKLPPIRGDGPFCAAARRCPLRIESKHTANSRNGGRRTSGWCAAQVHSSPWASAPSKGNYLSSFRRMSTFVAVEAVWAGPGHPTAPAPPHSSIAGERE